MKIQEAYTLGFKADSGEIETALDDFVNGGHDAQLNAMAQGAFDAHLEGRPSGLGVMLADCDTENDTLNIIENNVGQDKLEKTFRAIVKALDGKHLRSLADNAELREDIASPREQLLYGLADAEMDRRHNISNAAKPAAAFGKASPDGRKEGKHAIHTHPKNKRHLH